MLHPINPSAVFRRRALAVAAFTFLVPALAPAAEDPFPNLAANSGFEDADPAAPLPARWGGERAVYTRDDSTARTGKASLRYVNDDPARYRLCSQKVPAQPGRKYRFSVWVRTRDVVGKESGASICLEWADKAGKWLGGAYPEGVKGTRDWTKVEGIARVPPEAGGCTLTCYVRPGMTGTAWFDDVEMVLAADPALRTVLLSPVYRGRITSVGPEAVRISARLNLADYDLKDENVSLSGELVDAAGRVVQRALLRKHLEGQPDALSIPTKTLPVGKYTAVVRLQGPGGKPLQETRHEVVRLPDDFKPRACIDERRRLLLDGKPFFPLGMYWSGIEEADLKLYADSKFNCLMPYGAPTPAQMDLAHRLGLKVIYTVKDLYAGSTHTPKSIKTTADEESRVRETVRQFRDHPALLAWYLNDELPQSFMPRLEAHQRWVEEEDPNHPTWVVLFQVREVADYLRTFDVIGSDPYPIARHPASLAAEWTAETFRQVESARPMWQVPQAHHWGNYEEADKKKGRTPTYAEKRSMAWLLSAQGKYEEAEPLFMRSRAIAEEALGPDHPHVARSLLHHADLCRLQGRFDEAAVLLDKAQHIFHVAHKTDHPDIADGLHGAGMLWYSRGKYPEAERELSRALSIREKIFGPSHPAVALSLESLAVVFHQAGREAEAVSLENRAKEIRAKANTKDPVTYARKLDQRKG